MDAATGNNQRVCRIANGQCGNIQFTLARALAALIPDFWFKKLFHLHILAKGQIDRTTFRAVIHDCKCTRQGIQQLLRPGDTVKIPGDRA